MTEWREVVLSDLCDRVTVGHVGKMATEYVDDGVYFLRSQNVKPFSISHEGMLQISERFHRRLSKSALRAGDVVVVRTGYPGTAAVVPPDLDGSNCADLVVITPSDQLNPHVLAALFNSAWGRSTVGGQLVGSAQQHFNVGSAKAMRIRLPDRDGQDRIAAILCSLSDLIDNNRRRIELLEQMAQAIYREWFVRFRYPGHEGVPLVDSPVGPIPDGWEAAQLDSLVTTQYGYTESAEQEPVGPRYLRGMDINKTSYIDWSLVPYCPIQQTDIGRFRIHPGDVFVIRMADPGKVGICEVEVDAVFASYLVRVRPLADRIDSYYLFFTLRDDRYQGWVTGASTGATRKSVSAKVMTEPIIALPTRHVQKMFLEAVLPLRRLMNTLVQQNARLGQVRDLLLPRLVTGQIDVSKLDLDLLVDSVA